MPSGLLADLTQCSPTCRATLTGSPLPTAGSSPSTASASRSNGRIYRAKGDARYKLMTLDADEFIRRFLIHVLPQGFHRIRHYGLFASGTRAGNIARARRLLNASMAQSKTADATISSEPKPLSHPCPCCGSRMIIIETFRRGTSPRYRPAAPAAVIRIDTS